jgi:SsrA-binding protein
VGAKIALYENAGYTSHDPDRDRKLLLHKSQILKLRQRLEQKGFTLVPLRLYFNDRGYAKIELAVARGKKKYDKRDKITARQMNKETKQY